MLSNHISLEKGNIAETLPVLGTFTIFSKPEITNQRKEGELLFSSMSTSVQVFIEDNIGNEKDLYSQVLSYNSKNEAYTIIKELCLSNNDVLNNSVIKKEIMQDIIANDLDMMNISEEFVLERLLFLPNTRKIFIEMFLEKFEEEFSGDEIKDLPNKYKKSILAFLVGLCIVGKDIDPSAFEFVKRIANIFDIEEEYLEEFIEPVKSIHLARLELNELINE